MRPESISRPLLAALYLLTADGNLWNQVKDQISLRRVYVDDMRPKNLTGTSYVYFAAAKDILSGTRNIQLMEIADPALLSMKSYMILCTALAIRAFGVEWASRIQFNTEWEYYGTDCIENFEKERPHHHSLAHSGGTGFLSG